MMRPAAALLRTGSCLTEALTENPRGGDKQTDDGRNRDGRQPEAAAGQADPPGETGDVGQPQLRAEPPVGRLDQFGHEDGAPEPARREHQERQARDGQAGREPAGEPGAALARPGPGPGPGGQAGQQRRGEGPDLDRGREAEAGAAPGQPTRSGQLAGPEH